MKLEEIQEMVEVYEAKLEKLQPTLHPPVKKSISLREFGVLNLALKKEEKYTYILSVLKAKVKRGEDVPDDKIDFILKGI